MSTKTTSTTRRWVVPVVAVVLGIAMFVVVGLVRDDLEVGIVMLVIMVGYAAILVVFRRAEPIAMLGEDGGDERRRLLQLRASSFTTNVLALVIVGGFFIEVVRGEDGEPWTWLGLIGGVCFAGSLFFYSRRS
ncbi:DUF2178 domain-containing protein [Tenggerimyces flavus]|uniref:DUF2178 domain-containing protein n=1 Tax=Tenggerimyces flavus TaxID=1708749 RepID=A0ABV7YAR1_9ACTN|nr:DUF2178 domain-containing protein [Tenggerimyces flavus]MBM7785194.1 hypothetical protein [Tenggerimyces flavus]